jgi:ABC-type amino acid transport substrate-binding protein
MEKDKKILYGIGAIAVIAIIVAIFAVMKAPSNANVVTATEKTTFEKVMEKDEITLCYAVWPPSVTKDPNTGELSGFMIDIVNEMATDAQLKVNYVESTWGGFPADLNSGKCDAAIAAIYPTIGRSTAVSFTRPFLFAGNSGVVRADDDRFKTIDDLNNEKATIAVVQGEYGHIYAQKYLTKAKLLVLDKSSDNTAPLVAVSSKQADAGLIMASTVTDYVKLHPEVKDMFAGEPYSTVPVAWATRSKDQELLNFLDNAISYMKSTGTLDAMASKYAQTGFYTQKIEYVSVG